MKRFAIGFAVISMLVCFFAGCGSQPGETVAEGKRRHIRNRRIDHEQMMSDIDTALLLDKPSKLSDKRIQ